jgi:glycosyltransferase involved in cell wall biosynthesis
MKLLVVSPNFRREEFWKRWNLLVKKHEDISVILLAPSEWTEGSFKGYTFGKEVNYKSVSYEEERFKVIPIRMRQNMFGDWTSNDIPAIVNNEQPDFIYFIGHHAQISMMQTLRAAKKYCPSAKRLTFTMRSDVTSKKSKGSVKAKIIKLILHFVRSYNVKNSDVIFCHYPEAREAIIREGFKGFVYINTQIGVDTEQFAFSEEGRQRVRSKLGIDKDTFVFGSATRFNPEKGIFDILEALPAQGNWKYVILGSGIQEEIDAIKFRVKELGYDERVIMPGLIGWGELPDYLSALDCAIHVPRTTPSWKETFSLALVQAISVGLPMIGNTSGSVPYQCGPDGIIVQEGNISALRKAMVDFMNNPQKAVEIGRKQQEYVRSSFDIRVLSEYFYKALMDIMQGISHVDNIDTAASKNR